MIFYIDHIYFTLFKVAINVLFDVPSTWNHWLVAVTEPWVLMACTKKPWCLRHFIAAHGSLLWESHEWSKLYGCAEIFIPDADGRASSELLPRPDVCKACSQTTYVTNHTPDFGGRGLLYA